MPQAENRVRICAISPNSVQFLISWDLMQQMFAFHDKLFKPYGFSPKPWHERWKYHRIEFGRLHDMGLPNVLIRLESPSFDPHGARITPYGRQFAVRITARKLRVRPDIETQNLAFIADEGLRGLLVTFREEDMLAAEDDPSPIKIPRNDMDLAVHTHEKRR
jgi:hypothetical protein